MVMKRIWKHIIIFLPVLLAWNSFSQETDPERNIEAIEESGASLIIEDLESLAENPLNLNSASASELSKLHLLNDIQIQNLINYREQFGAVYSVYELNSVEGFFPDLLLKMEPFIWFGPVEEDIC